MATVLRMIEYFFMVLPFRRQSGFAVVNANRQQIIGENLLLRQTRITCALQRHCRKKSVL